MNSEQVKESLQRVLQIVEQSNIRELSDIERDIALGNLRDVYAWLRFERAMPEGVAAISAPVMPQEPEIECEEQDEPEIEVEIITLDEAEDEPREEYVEPQVQSLNVEPSNHRVQDAAEEPVSQSVAGADMLGGLRPSPRSSILSLYDEPKAADVATTPRGVTGGEEQVIGEIFRCERPAVGDSISRPKSMSEAAPVVSLNTAIGVADRYMLVRELFNDDAAAYEKAIAQLDAMPSLDDCMIYIAENYSWRSGSDAARLLVELLQRKYQR